MTTHFMIDLETLGSNVQAPIIQVGICAFDIESGTVKPAITVGVTPDFKSFPPSWSTICWWANQSDAARQAVFRSGTLTFAGAYMLVKQYMLDHAGNDALIEDDIYVWAMPPQFDLSIWDNHRDVYDLPALWPYNKTLDLRTLEWLMMKKKGDRVRSAIEHDAGQDAIAQANTVIKYLRGARIEPAFTS